MAVLMAVLKAELTGHLKVARLAVQSVCSRADGSAVHLAEYLDSVWVVQMVKSRAGRKVR